jgi:hypothetical protein
MADGHASAQPTASNVLRYSPAVCTWLGGWANKSLSLAVSCAASSLRFLQLTVRFYNLTNAMAVQMIKLTGNQPCLS